MVPCKPVSFTGPPFSGGAIFALCQMFVPEDENFAICEKFKPEKIPTVTESSGFKTRSLTTLLPASNPSILAAKSSEPLGEYLAMKPVRSEELV